MVISVYFTVRNKWDFKPLKWYNYIPCWLGETASLVYVVGYVAGKCEDSRKVLLLEIVAMTLALIGMTLGGKLINFTNKRWWQSLTTIFLVLAFLLAVAIYASKRLEIYAMKYTPKLIFWIIFAMGFMIFDTTWILDGKYVQITVHDSVFASVKLFADFVLFFGLLYKMCLGECAHANSKV